MLLKNLINFIDDNINIKLYDIPAHGIYDDTHIIFNFIIKNNNKNNYFNINNIKKYANYNICYRGVRVCDDVLHIYIYKQLYI